MEGFCYFYEGVKHLDL